MKGLILSTMLALALALIPAAANATTVEECQAALDALETEVATVTFIQKSEEKAEKARLGLTGKIDQASLKLAQAKFCDAIQKLDDFQKKVDQLVKGGGINSDPLLGTTGADLIAAADAAISSIRELSAQSGGAC